MRRESEIAHNLSLVLNRIEEACASAGRNRSEVTLIAVTKNFPVEDLQILHDLGLRDFGENRDQEGAGKSQSLPRDISWHFLGQIQSRKITSISQWAKYVHSLHSIDHARKFESMLTKNPFAVENFFVQVNFEPERSDRGGVAPSQLGTFLLELHEQTKIRPRGLMTVAPLSMEPSAIFEELREIQLELISLYPGMGELSMGMSGDLEEAIMAGATHIRVGSSILGSRVFPA